MAVNDYVNDFIKEKEQLTKLQAVHQVLKTGDYECIQAVEKEMDFKIQKLTKLKDKLDFYNIFVAI